MRLSENEVLAQSRAAFGQWGEQWKRHAKANGDIMRERGISQKDLLNTGIGRQLLLCAGGPSLGENLETIRRYRANTDVGCVDKAFGLLMDAGIRPEWVFLADANVSWEYADGRDTEGVHLIANINASTEWTSRWKGPITFYVNKDNIRTEEIYMEISGCREVIPAASNVGNAAVVFCTQIFLYDRYLMIGYDHGWKRGAYYASGGMDAIRTGSGTAHAKQCWQKEVFGLGIDGELTYASGNMSFSARWLMDFHERILQNRVKIHNCGGVGYIAIEPRRLEPRLANFRPRELTDKERNLILTSRALTRRVKADELQATFRELGEAVVIGCDIAYVLRLPPELEKKAS